ncbi:hypothetical protein CI238_00152, partial [Colletotrichum incanum]
LMVVVNGFCDMFIPASAESCRQSPPLPLPSFLTSSTPFIQMHTVASNESRPPAIPRSRLAIAPPITTDCRRTGTEAMHRPTRPVRLLTCLGQVRGILLISNGHHARLARWLRVCLAFLSR